jgi:hypothetical protein
VSQPPRVIMAAPARPGAGHGEAPALGTGASRAGRARRPRHRRQAIRRLPKVASAQMMKTFRAIRMIDQIGYHGRNMKLVMP